MTTPMRDLPKLKIELKKPESFKNLASRLDANERRMLATDLITLIGIDEQSMSDWLGEAKGFLNMAEADKGTSSVPANSEQEGAGEGAPPSTEMTLAAVIQFSARAAGALLGEPDLAKASVPGAEPLAKWVSTEVRSTDPNWILETDPLVVHMAVTGLAWRKRAFDTFDRAFHSYFCTSSEIIINASVRSVERAPRITHQFERYPYEIDRSIRRKHWVNYEPKYDDKDPQHPKRFYECDCWLDLDGDEVDEPWTVTISRDDMAEVVRIEPRWTKKTIVEDDETLFFKPVRRFYPYRFLPDPKGGFFPQGFGKLLTRTEAAADNLLASIVDTAKSEAKNGGVMGGGGTGLPATSVELKENRITTIPTDGRSLSDMFTVFPAKQVSSGSVAVLEKIITLGDRVSGTLNLLENAPASMSATLAKGLIDNGTQIQSAVHRRLVTSMTQEFHMFVHMADAYDMLPEEVQASDASSVAVTADPQLATEMQRAAQGNIYLEMTQNPVFNVFEAAKRFCETMRLPNPEKLIGQPQPAQIEPGDKLRAAIDMEKARTDRIKVMGGIALSFSQSIKNLVDAGGGMVDIQSTMLQMAQLETIVQQMISEAQNGGTQLGGMAGAAGNAGAPQLPPPAQTGGGEELPAGGTGGPGATGDGQGV